MLDSAMRARSCETCMRSHVSAVLPKAFASRTAISAEMAAFSLTRLFSAWRLTPRTRAPSVTVRPSGSRHSSRTIRPGWGGFFASSAESVGRFWFRESSQVVIKGNFHSVEGTKAVGSSGNHSDFVIETLNGTIGDFSFGSKPIQYQRLMGAQHAGHPFHRFQTATHGPGAPIVEKGAGPNHGFVVPEMGEGLLQIPGPCGGQLAGKQGFELLPSPPAYPAAAA